MRSLAIRALGAAAAVCALAGCAGDGPRHPNLSQIPLVPGVRVVASANVCDQGANAYCALDAVIVASRFKSSQELAAGERRWLKRSGWIRVSAQTGDELAADSPRDRFRLTYATAALDLRDIDLGWIKRPRPIALALARAIYDGSAALSLNVAAGPS